MQTGQERSRRARDSNCHLDRVAQVGTSERIKNGRGHTGGEDNDWYAESIMPAMEPSAALIVGKLFVAGPFKPAGDEFLDIRVHTPAPNHVPNSDNLNLIAKARRKK